MNSAWLPREDGEKKCKRKKVKKCLEICLCGSVLLAVLGGSSCAPQCPGGKIISLGSLQILQMKSWPHSSH